jgi:hypothetical protein
MRPIKRKKERERRERKLRKRQRSGRRIGEGGGNI